jgi:hypothetical protein
VPPTVAGMALVLGEGNVYVNQGEKVDEGSLSQGVDIGQSLTNSGNGLAGRKQVAGLLTAIMPLMSRSERNPHGLPVNSLAGLTPRALARARIFMRLMFRLPPDFQ